MIIPLLFISIFLSFIPASAGTVDFDGSFPGMPPIEITGGNLYVPVIPPADIAQNRGIKEWTVMVFDNGKNALEDCGLSDVNDLEEAGSSENVNVVVELGRIKGFEASDGDWTGSRRYLIQKDFDKNRITSPVLMEIKDSDMGDWRYLAGFVRWVKVNFPARKYALIIADHGNGWKPVDSVNAITRGISLDEETNHEISVLETGKAFAEIGWLDLYGADACNMQMMDVAYEIKDHVGIIAGSEETVPGAGYAYGAFMNLLNNNPTATPEELGYYMVSTYSEYFLNGGDNESMSVTQSVIRTSQLEPLKKLLDDWTRLVMAENDRSLMEKAKKSARFFDDRDYKDLYDFVSAYGRETASPEIREKSGEILRHIETGLIASNWAMAGNAHGLSINIPHASYDQAYDLLNFPREGLWGDFARWSAGIYSRSSGKRYKK
ncbi:MAG: clostripain-related cysteine peptidase [bacterium]